MKNFAIKHKLKIIIVLAHYNRLSFFDVKIDELLNCFDSFEMSSAKLFFYNKNASVISLSNLNSSLRLVNKCRRFVSRCGAVLKNELSVFAITTKSL